MLLECTAVTVVRSARGEVGYPTCELAEDHDGEHAEFLWDDDATGDAVWLRWGPHGARFVPLPWCETLQSEYGDACTLFRGHPAAHSWAYTDPTREAVDRFLESQHPHFFHRDDE